MRKFNPPGAFPQVPPAEHAYPAIFLIGSSERRIEALRQLARSVPGRVAYVDLSGASFTENMGVEYAGKIARYRVGIYPVCVDAAESVIVRSPERNIELVQLLFAQCLIDRTWRGQPRHLILPVPVRSSVAKFDFPPDQVLCLPVNDETLTTL